MAQRPSLPGKTIKKLDSETQSILRATDPKAEAERRYNNARRTQWFLPVIESLLQIAGEAGCCMFCSWSEGNQVEHYRPIAKDHHLALTWENLLWACGICNQNKGNRFPLEPDQILINPVDEDVWSFFFIDQYGELTARFNRGLNASEPRSISTMNIVGLDRERLQRSRRKKLKDLRQWVDDTIRLFESGQIPQSEVSTRIETWRNTAHQPDVADYFLNGPGKEDSPFKELFSLIESNHS